jgi:RHS repeat-associated protein
MEDQTPGQIPAKQFVWHDNEIVQERVGTSATAGTIARNHYFGGFTIGATVSTAAKCQTFTDHLGHVREVVAASGTHPAIGTVLTRYEYSPYQGPTKVYQFPSTNVEATVQTIGRYYHHEPSGLELALYRAYDPELGRWISEDPLEEEGGLNLYEFVEGEPVGWLDDLGDQRGRGGRDRLGDDPKFQDPDNVKGQKHRGQRNKQKRQNNHRLPPKKKPRNDGGSSKCVAAGAGIAGAALFGYGAYRCARMVPSLAPPLWWTIPGNFAIP